jgi:hypothetical protein
MNKLAFLAALVMVPMLAQAQDFRISMDRKKDGGGNMKGDVEMKTSQNWVGEIKIENLTFKPTADLELRYIIFVKRQELGQKAGMDQVDQVKGTIPVKSLQGREKASFTTSEVTLRQQALDAHYRFTSGGSTKAADTVLGVWVKLFNGQTELMEYVNPTTLKAKNKWE